MRRRVLASQKGSKHDIAPLNLYPPARSRVR